MFTGLLALWMEKPQVRASVTPIARAYASPLEISIRVSSSLPWPYGSGGRDPGRACRGWRCGSAPVELRTAPADLRKRLSSGNQPTSFVGSYATDGVMGTESVNRGHRPRFAPQPSSIHTVRIEEVVRPAAAALEDAEIQLIHVAVFVEITAIAARTPGNRRSREASHENVEVRLIHVAVVVQVGRKRRF